MFEFARNFRCKERVTLRVVAVATAKSEEIVFEQGQKIMALDGLTKKQEVLLFRADGGRKMFIARQFLEQHFEELA